ncbi:MAG: hypothetical protein A2010_06615 [Nitrospirae bacterium GWD2_57_9]|nr:MAG: hypothetical protein A2010_06615 [Nitrospirae bacterium GWD2_57_9]OGW50941.1 MAG: hypothetical protein A2078_15180 [Nitrospirae bacterium GWC2_57_9]
MKKYIYALTILCSLLALALASSPIVSAKSGGSIKKVAVVSLTVSDVAGSVRAGSIGTTPVSKLIDSSVNSMLSDAEKKLGGKWTVVKASGFIDNAGYRKAGVKKTLTVYVPKVNGREMPVFTQVSKEIKGGKIDPQKAKDLCRALNVDGVVLIFSEWASKTGGMVPTTKAMTKNILTVWDRNGDQVIKERVDMVGKRSLGFSGVKAVNKDTIGEWRDAYSRALDKIVSSL